MGAYSLLCLGLGALILISVRGHENPAFATLAVGTIGLIAVMTIGVGLLVFAPSRNRLVLMLPASWEVAWAQTFELYQQRRVPLLGCFGLSLLCSMVSIACFVLAGRILGEAVTWDVAFLTTPIVAVANVLPITPGGIGTAEAISSEVFGSFGLSEGAEMMVLVRLCSALLSLPGGLVVFKGSFHSRKQTWSDHESHANP